MTVDSSPLYEDIFEVAPHPIMVHDAETGVVCRANPAACELVGIDRERLEGSAVGAFSPPGFTTSDALAKIREAAETGHAAVEWVVADSDGTHRSVEVELRSADIADACRVIACINDVTEYRELDRRERTRDEQLRTLGENLPVVVFTFDPDGVFTYADGTGLGSLGLEGDELEGTSVFEAYEQCPDVVDAARRATDGEEVRVTQEVEEVVFETWYQPVFDEGSNLSQVIGVARDVTDRRRREERVERLSDATNELLYSRTEEAVAETVTTIARQIIGRPLAAVWSYDEQADTLLPIGSTIAAAEFAGVDVAADLPPMEGDCAEKRIFDAGDPVVIEDYQSVENVSAPGVPLGTLLCVPLDDFGLLCVGSTEVAPFSETERFLLDILAGTATAALDRVAREASMRRQRETLQRRTDQMEFFNSILRHDMLNGMEVIRARGELLAESLDGTDREYAETIVTWSDDIIDLTQKVRSVLETLSEDGLTEMKRRRLADVLEAGADRARTRSRECTVRVDVGDIEVTADDLLEDVFGNIFLNAVEHGREDVSVDVTAAAAEDADRVRLADDGPGIPPEQRRRVFQRGEKGTGSSGTGFGLYFVDSMVESYGGDVWIEDSEAGGAAFVVELPRTE